MRQRRVPGGRTALKFDVAHAGVLTNTAARGRRSGGDGQPALPHVVRGWLSCPFIFLPVVFPAQAGVHYDCSATYNGAMDSSLCWNDGWKEGRADLPSERLRGGLARAHAGVFAHWQKLP